MKKILAVLIAISMVATMAFAADAAFSVNVTANGSLLKIEDFAAANDGTALNEGAEFRPTWGGAGSVVDMTFASSDDNAGAKVVLHVTKDGAVADDTSLWIKPIDMLKVTFFSASIKVGSESVFNPDGTDYGKIAGDYGVTLTPVEGLTIDVVTAAGIPFDGTLPVAGAKVAYALDGVGTIAATGSFGMAKAPTTGENAKPAVKLQYAVAFESAKIADILKANAYFEYADGKMKAFETATVECGPVTVFEEVLIDDFAAIVPAVDVKVSGSVADVDLACEAKWADVREVAKLTVTPSAEIAGTVGAASWTLGAKVPVDLTSANAKVGVEVPYSVTIAF